MKQTIVAILVSLFVVFIFFYQVFVGRIPFPGDLLIGNQEPYKSYSYDGFVAGSYPHKAQGPDVIHELLPWKKFTIESWKKLQVPLWYPNNFSGNPLAANFQSGVFYPGNLIFFILNFTTAWTIYIFLTPLLSIIFTFLFLRRLKLSFAASIFGGVSFAFSLYMTVWMEYGNIGHTFLWLPLILYFSDKFIEKTNRASFIGIVVSGFCAAVAGYIQGLFYIYAIVSIYYFAKAYSLKKVPLKKTFLFLIALAFPILLSLFQILPTLELFSQSTRGNYSLEQIQKMLNPVYYLLTVVAPDFFGNPASRNFWFDGTYIERVSYFGLIPFTFALTAIITLWKRIEVKIFTVLFIFAVLISTDVFITRFFYLIPIPVLSTTVATRILSVFAFSGAMLAAFGFDSVLRGEQRKKVLNVSISILVFLICVFGFIFVYPKSIQEETMILNLGISKRNMYIPLVSIILLLLSVMYFYYFKWFKKYNKNLFTVAIFAISIFELFYYFQKITPFAPPKYMYPQTPVVEFLQKNGGINRAWGYGTAYIDSNFQTFDGTYSPDGNDPLHIKNYTELLAASKNGLLPDLLPRPDANIAGGFGSQDLAANLYRQKVLNITGVGYVLNRNEGLGRNLSPDTVTFPDDKYSLAWQNGFWQAYKNTDVTQRFYLTNKYVVVDKSNGLKTLFNKNFDEKSTLMLYENPRTKKGNFVGDARLISYLPNRIEIQTNATQSALLYLSDNYYPGWDARIDNKSTKIYLANYTFRAIDVPAGLHKITFEFKPKSFYYGLYLSIATLVAFVSIVKFGFKNEK